MARPDPRGIVSISTFEKSYWAVDVKATITLKATNIIPRHRVACRRVRTQVMPPLLFKALPPIPKNRNTGNLARGCDTVRRMGDDAPEDLGAGAETPGSPSQNADRDSDRNPDNNYDRDLGVVEAITFVTRSCPSGVVISVANQALEAIKTDGADVIKQQAYFVLTAIQGWRGDRARQVHRSLTKYLEESSSS